MNALKSCAVSSRKSVEIHNIQLKAEYSFAPDFPPMRERFGANIVAYFAFTSLVILLVALPVVLPVPSAQT